MAAAKAHASGGRRRTPGRRPPEAAPTSPLPPPPPPLSPLPPAPPPRPPLPPAAPPPRPPTLAEKSSEMGRDTPELAGDRGEASGEMTSEMASETNPASDRVMGVGNLGVPEIAMAGEMAGEIPSPGREGELGSRACKRSRVGEVRWRAVLAYTSGPVGEGRLRRGRGTASGGGAAGGEAATGERPGR